MQPLGKYWKNPGKICENLLPRNLISMDFPKVFPDFPRNCMKVGRPNIYKSGKILGKTLGKYWENLLLRN
jgi:hypothetical protein